MIELTAKTLVRSIRVYRRGVIVISAQLSRDMGIQNGDRVQIFMSRDGGYPELYIAKGDTGVIAKKRKNDSSMRIFSRQVADELLKGSEKGIYRVGDMVVKDGRELYSIIYMRNYAEREEIHQVQGDHQAAI